MSTPRVTMYGNASCPYCGAARLLLTNKAVEYTDINVAADEAMRLEMQERSGATSVPQIFIGDTHIGGFDQLYMLDQSGELDSLLGTSSAE